MKNERFLTEQDAATLSQLADELLLVRDAKVNFTNKLNELISASTLLPDDRGRADCVALHSTVTYRTVGSNDRKSLVIVCPEDADSASGRISILAPLAMALLGHCKRSIVEFHLPFNQTQFVEIMDVEPASAEGNEAACIAPDFDADKSAGLPHEAA